MFKHEFQVSEFYALFIDPVTDEVQTTYVSKSV